MANENDTSIEISIKFELMEMQGANEGKFWVKAATPKKMIWYAEFPNYDEAKIEYDKILNTYGYGE
jgi:hypothetical protein